MSQVKNRDFYLALGTDAGYAGLANEKPEGKLSWQEKAFQDGYSAGKMRRELDDKQAAQQATETQAGEEAKVADMTRQHEAEMAAKTDKPTEAETGIPQSTIDKLEQAVSEGRLVKHGKFDYALPGEPAPGMQTSYDLGKEVLGIKDEDDPLHPAYKGTETGRVSSEGPDWSRITNGPKSAPVEPKRKAPTPRLDSATAAARNRPRMQHMARLQEEMAACKDPKRRDRLQRSLDRAYSRTAA